MKLYNTLSRQEEELPSPQEHPTISLYSCGPTVYDDTHIGHMRRYAMDDILVRSLKYLGYDVKHVMNITDVGHLSGDDDSGDDKLEKGAKKSGKTVWDVAHAYTDSFFETMDALGIKRPDEVMKATDNIGPMIDLVKQLETKGYTYETDQAIYFDVSKFKDYGKLSGQKLEDKKQAVREEVYRDRDKKHPADFALWFKRVGRFADHTMHWGSPWGDGFPGWHIECSAMSMKALGPTIDIHTGGIDHIPVHHENEIAQSEAATGKQFVKWWVHHAFLMVDGEKMSKSKGNFYTLKDIQERGIDPIALRYLFLQTHYRKQMNFTWGAVNNVNEALKNMKHKMNSMINKNDDAGTETNAEEYRERFKKSLENDLQTAQALAVLWDMLNSNLTSQLKLKLLIEFDDVLGLGIGETTKDMKRSTTFVEDIPADVAALVEARVQARIEKKFTKSDKLRRQIEEKGYEIEDISDGYRIKKK